MRRHAIIGFLGCLFIIWLVMVAYLAGLTPVQETAQRINRGIEPVAGQPGSGPFDFEDTNQLAAGYLLDRPNESSKKDIYFVQGRNVDNNGDAESWLYGVKNPLGSFLLVYDRTGWKEIAWKGQLPDKRLDLNTLYPLGKLLQEHKDLFVQSQMTEPWQVDLSNNLYQISGSDGTITRSYSFNAITGAMI